ncbi:hypothetical protein [Kitasatospora sp. NPDC085464]|uniref:hypothetical protein n=1 Tax=Kitasatospora sp. NPDC085464 TaxID=3364063 RepID=UPI0037CB1F60
MIRRISALLVVAAALLPITTAHDLHAPTSAVALDDSGDSGASTSGGHTQTREPTHG